LSVFPVFLAVYFYFSLNESIICSEGVAEDAEKAVRYLQLAAKDSGKGGKGGGHREAEWDEAVAEAQRVLGLCYFNGEGTVQDEGRAAALWGRAAGKGDAVAAGMLAHCFAHGLGVAQNWRQAAK
jgi:TPR repeat protein